MIVRDEEKTLERVLKNAWIYADEIIIVDTGSKDKTKEIAGKYTQNIFDYVWRDDFSHARNYSFDRATGEYIIWLDGDDFMPDEVAYKIKKWKENGEGDVVMCPYVLSYDESTPKFHFLRERIVKNTPSLRWHERVHEVIIPRGKIVNNEGILIYHGKIKKHTNRNLKIYRKMLKNGEKLSPRGLFYFARELYYNGYYREGIRTFKKFLKGEGFIENKIEACKFLAYCYEELGDNDRALDSLFSSFKLAPPRGEIMYEIGRIFSKIRGYDRGIFWLKQALANKDDLRKGGFVDEDKTGLFPALELVVCYYNLGDKKSAKFYHEISKSLSPNNPAVKYNDEFFRKI